MPDYKEKARGIQVAALVILARAGIPTDVQDLLVNGDPMRGIPPGALESALREAHEAGRREEWEGWQPIETAPKDGTPIWLGSEHGSMRVGLWEDGAQHENHGTVGGGWRDFYRIECDGQRDTLWPVVWWHPLPSPPTILSEQGDG